MERLKAESEEKGIADSKEGNITRQLPGGIEPWLFETRYGFAPRHVNANKFLATLRHQTCIRGRR